MVDVSGVSDGIEVSPAQLDPVKLSGDLRSAISEHFYPVGFNNTLKDSSDYAVLGKSLITPGMVTTEQIQITGLPKRIGVFLSAFDFVDGTHIAAALQLSFDLGKTWQTAVSFTVDERGKTPDGKDPAAEWGATVFNAFPFPDCLARGMILVSDRELITSVVIRY